MSDYLAGNLPQNWLQSVFPDLSEKLRGVPMHQLDGIFHSTASTSSVVPYILACSTLFSSAEEALHNINSVPGEFIKRSKNSVIKFNAKLRNHYIQAKGKHDALDGHSFPDKSIVLAGLENLGLPDLIDTETHSALVAVRSFFSDKKSLVDSAALGHIEIVTLEDIIRKIGCHINPTLNDIAGL